MKSILKPDTYFLKNMKTINQSRLPGVHKTHSPVFPRLSLILALGLAFPVVIHAAPDAPTIGKVYATPEAAVAELKVATSNADTNAMRAIFGPAYVDLQNADRVQATNDFAKFSQALIATNHLVHVSDSKIVLELGDDLWPFPVPLVKGQGGWHFDTEAGEEEIINRRIGKNELEVLSVMRQYVDAQREYASVDRDGDQVLEYAQRISSSPGKMDGLYWPIELNGEMSPFGPMVAEAQGKGYFARKAEAELNSDPAPFHGYYFKILTRQGKHAPGGKYDYIINGNMIGGFAMVAWPADYGESGIMTFIVNQQGRVYQKNLGEKTTKIVHKMDAYDPDPSWKVSPD
jgi:hypothetical protein